MKSKSETFKKKYEEGYRCIFKENESKGCTYHLKDFRTEKIESIKAKNQMEVGEIEDFLDFLKDVKERQGNECICIADERDQD